MSDTFKLTQTDAEVQELLNAVPGKYVKPSTGIPESDLSEAVRQKLSTDIGIFVEDHTAVTDPVENQLYLEQTIVAGTYEQWLYSDGAWTSNGTFSLGLSVDDELSDSSENPVQNKVVNTAITTLTNTLNAEIARAQAADRYQKLISQIDLSATASRYTLSNARIPFVVGNTYRITVILGATLSAPMGVRLFETTSPSGTNKSLFVIPAGSSSCVFDYTPDEDTNYQYLGVYNNMAVTVSVSMTALLASPITDKVRDIDSEIYLEQPFQQGTLARDGVTEVDSSALIVSADFISIPYAVTLATKSGYQITRVWAYNQDGTLNALLLDDTYVSSYELTDISLKYKFNVRKEDGSAITIDDDCMEWHSVKDFVCNPSSSVSTTVSGLNAGLRRIYVAASDSTAEAKAIADYVCDGVNDEVEIQAAINSLTYGGTVQLLDGQYNIDAFPTYIEGNNEYVAIFIAGNSSVCRTVNLVGTTENKSYNSRYGVHIHVSATAIAGMNDESTYVCIKGSGIRPSTYGTYTFTNNANFENFHLYIGDAEKKMVGIDCSQFGGTRMKHVGIYTEHYFERRFNHTVLTEDMAPVIGSVGIITNCGSNDAMDCGFEYVECSGMYIGLMTQDQSSSGDGIDHLIMTGCCFCRCVYGLYFVAGTTKTMTLINCCEEGCRHLPYFGGSGHITAIDLNIERFDSRYYPIDLAGNTEFYAIEEAATSETSMNGWVGTIEYTLQGWSGADSGSSGKHFWKNDGSGKGIRTRNLNYDHKGNSAPYCGEYLERYFDTTNNVWKTWNGSEWV